MNRIQNVITRIRTYKNWPWLIWPLNRFNKGIYRTRSGIVVYADIFGDDWCVMNEMFGRDDYNLKQIRLPDHPLIVDAGANIGDFTLFASTIFPTARFLTLEPSQENVLKAEKNLKINKISYEMLPVALANTDEQRTFYMSVNKHSHSLDKTKVEHGAKPITVECISLKRLLQRCNGKIDLLKLDIEGAEYEVLLGADLSSIGAIAIEIHDDTRKEQLLDYLKQHYMVNLSATRYNVYWCVKK